MDELTARAHDAREGDRVALSAFARGLRDDVGCLVTAGCGRGLGAIRSRLPRARTWLVAEMRPAALPPG